MNSTPGPPNCDMVAVVHHLVDIALEVRESGSEYLQLGIESLPAADRMAIEGNMRNEILCECLRVFRSIASSGKDDCKTLGKGIRADNRLCWAGGVHEA